MNRDQLNQKIQQDVTNKTNPASITPRILGGVLKEMTDSLATLSELEAYAGRSMEQFINVPVIGRNIEISQDATPYARIQLAGDYPVYDLKIIDVTDGDTGKLLILQPGNRQIALDASITGTVEMPLNPGTILLCSYNVVGTKIYLYSDVVLGDNGSVMIQPINDLMTRYFDNSSVSLQWTAPHAETLEEPVTYYDIRYSNNLIDPENQTQWNSIKRVNNTIIPAAPGQLESFTIIGLKPGTDYYIYIKGAKVILGLTNFSASSNILHFKTNGAANIDEATYNIPVEPASLYPQHYSYIVDPATNIVGAIGNMVDEKEKNKFLPSGYPDTDNKDYQTYWLTYKYSRDTVPFNIDIDLYQMYRLDRIYTYGGTKRLATIYGSKGFGYPWVRVGEMNTDFNAWGYVNFDKAEYRLIRISFDIIDFGSMSTLPPMPAGTEAFPDPQYGTTEKISNMLIYGMPLSKPDKIHEPLRRTTIKKTVDEFFCVNGHAYQQGRIHAFAGGSKPRLYIHFGQFGQFDTNGALMTPTSVSGLRFRINDIPWVKANSGLNEGLEYNLTNTYKKYGLKPYLVNSGVFDINYYDKTKYLHNRPLDDYWYPGAWKPVPKRGFDGLVRYYGKTKDAANYKTYTKLGFALGAKYGNNPSLNGNNLFWPATESTTTGLNLISGIEMENEPDGNWNGWIGYESNEEYAAILSASSDAHANTLKDEAGTDLGGIKASNILAVSSGTAGINKGYYFSALHWWKSNRPDANVPVDALSMHRYFSNVGNQGTNSSDPIRYGVTLESSLRPGDLGGSVTDIVDIRDRLSPKTEIWLTEFGWGEAGAEGTKSSYQCYTQPGRIVNGWNIPDRHRSEVKGAWTVRATLQLMSLGFDMVNYYSTECENNYFDNTRWGAGPGFEMFHWNDITDTTPGAKATYIKQFEHQFERGGFSAMGLFGQILGNGAYPITNAYWWTATMRNTLKGYIYYGKKKTADPKVVILAFKKADENKGAYVIYYNDMINTGVTGVELNVPGGLSSVEKVTVYIPQIPNPLSVPRALGNNQARTGIPTSRRERYTNGAWVITNKPYNGNNHSSYTSAPAVYPPNPQEGDEVTTLPTAQENPYFPIVGPVQARPSSNDLNLTAEQYEQQYDSGGGVMKWEAKGNSILSWRQVDAVLDYIQFHPEGIKGAHGTKTTLNALAGKLTLNVSEFPEFYLFDALPEVDYESYITDLSAVPINDSTIELWWNNTNVEDTGYDIFMSSLPETGYTLHSSINVSTENKTRIQGLSANTTYYFKVRPRKGNDLVGIISEEVAVKTFSLLYAPTDLAVGGQSTNTIFLYWQYPQGQLADFLYYGIYRADASSVYALVGQVENINTKSFLDTGLSIGKNYLYKVRAVGLNGLSEYSNEVSTRTLLPEEMPPVLKQAATDKLGIKINLEFDMDVALINNAHSFVIEVASPPYGSDELAVEVIEYTDLYVIPEKPNTIVLVVPRFSLPEFEGIDRRILVSYEGTNVVSALGNILLDGFERYLVKNKNGDFSGISRVFNINFTDTANIEEGKWNSLIHATGTVEYPNLKTTKEEASEIKITKIDNGSNFRWGSVGQGLTNLLDIPINVWRRSWSTSYGAKENEAIKARLVFGNLDEDKIYKAEVYGGQPDNDPLLKRPARIRVGDDYSETLQLSLNRAKYMVIENIKIGPTRLFNMDLITMYPTSSSNNTTYPAINWMILTEMDNPDGQVNKELLMRGMTVSPINPKGDILNATINVAYNLIGVANRYRISETEDMEGVPWVNIPESSNLVFSYTVSNPNAPTVTIYAQAANNNNETETFSYQGALKTTFGLAEFNLNLINNKLITTKRQILANLIYTGNATEYAVQTNDDFSSATWLPLTNQFEVVLSDGLGLKTLYARVRNAQQTESTTVTKVIELISDINETIIFNNGDAFGVNKSNKVKQSPIGDTGLYSSEFDVDYYSSVKPGFGSHYMYNTLGELTNIMIHFNSEKYPIVNNLNFKSQSTELGYRDGYTVTPEIRSQYEYPLNILDTTEARSPENIGEKANFRARIAMNLPAGKYALKVITTVPYNELAISQNQVNNSFFTIVNATTNLEIARKPMGPAEWNGVNNTDFNVIMPFELTEPFTEIYISPFAPTFPRSPIYHRMLLIKNYLLIEPLTLEGVMVNNGADLTYATTVELRPLYRGIPVEYRVADTESQLLTAPWQAYNGNTFNYTFPDSAGLKFIYVQLRSEDVTSDIKFGNINYIKDNIDITEFTVTLPVGIDPASITMDFAKNKFNKKILFSYITDDACSIYQFIFNGINKRYVATRENRFFHLNFPISPEFLEGFTPPYPLEFTDGAGNKRRFATSVAGWPEKLVDTSGAIGADVGMYWPWMTEKEFKFFKDFGFTMLYHDLNNYDKATVTQEKFIEWFDNTKAQFIAYLGADLIPKGLAEPNGDHQYLKFSQAVYDLKFLTAQSGDTLIKKVYPYRPDYTLDKSKVAIERFFQVGTDYSDRIINQLTAHSNTADLSTIQWLIGAAHKSGLHEYELFKRINDTFGAIGLDNIWFATLDEIYEYWFLTKNALVEKIIINSNTVKFKLTTPIIERFWFKEVTCLLSGITNIDGITVTSNTDGLSYNINNNKLMVNLNFTGGLTVKAEKYTSQFEANPIDPYTYDNAMYMIQQLKPVLRQYYLDRVNALLNPVSLTSILLNNGDPTHTGKTVSVEFVIAEGTPTNYRIAETLEALEAASWVAWSNTINYTFASYGNKTLYGQVKNQTNESAIKSDTIQLIESLPKILLGFNAGANNTVTKISTNGLMTNQINYAMYISYTPKVLVSTENISIPEVVLNLNSSFYAANEQFIASGTFSVTSAFATVASGPYSLETMKKNILAGTSGAENLLRKSRLSFSLAVGTYRFRILFNVPSSGFGAIPNNAGRITTFYGIFQGATELVRAYVSQDPSFSGIDNQDFNCTLEFTISDSSIPVDLGGWSTTLNNRPAINLIEITKLS